jgi:cysteinyl-tRNA synthetase
MASCRWKGAKCRSREGNFVTIHDVLHTEKVGGRKWPGEVVRLALLMTHYREPLDFSVKRLEEAERVDASKWVGRSRSHGMTPSMPDRLCS